MTDRELSKLQKEYRSFFLEKLHSYGVNSPAELTKEKKSEFFTAIKHDWAIVKLGKKQYATVLDNSPSVVSDTLQQVFKSSKPPSEPRHFGRTEYTSTPAEFRRQAIKSLPNTEQTDDLRIRFTPNSHFEQGPNYCYPVVKMPKQNASLKLPRLGRTNQRGYKEKSFTNDLRLHITDLEVADDVHMVIPNFKRPYEPDIVLFDKSRNLYIDIEIDESFDGFYRYPTHCIKYEQPFKQDDIRDLFFVESGWIVIRFTERQVHLESRECISHIRNVINSLSVQEFDKTVKCEIENQWDENQSIQWQKSHYREKYLEIVSFHKNFSSHQIEIDINENESIEDVIQRTKKFNPKASGSDIAFDEETHIYLNPKDQTGNAQYISVTTLIERFFPFDLKRYVEKKAIEENRTEEEVLIDFLMIRDEAAERGTYLHNQIENYLKGLEFTPDIKEFNLFLNFFESQIKPRGLQFADAEKRIVSTQYNVAGTIDCLFQKGDKNEYIMLDWKRSKKLIVDGYPKKYGYGCALSQLHHLDNSSYYKYCLQQNIYKYIAENEYGLNISSMKLVVLHDCYPEYYIISVPEMLNETKIILNSLQHKI